MSQCKGIDRAKPRRWTTIKITIMYILIYNQNWHNKEGNNGQSIRNGLESAGCTIIIVNCNPALGLGSVYALTLANYLFIVFSAYFYGFIFHLLRACSHGHVGHIGDFGGIVYGLMKIRFLRPTS